MSLLLILTKQKTIVLGFFSSVLNSGFLVFGNQPTVYSGRDTRGREVANGISDM